MIIQGNWERSIFRRIRVRLHQMCFRFWPNTQGLRFTVFSCLGLSLEDRICSIVFFGADGLRGGWPNYSILSIFIRSPKINTLYPQAGNDLPAYPYSTSLVRRSTHAPLVRLRGGVVPGLSSATGQADHCLVSPRWGRSGAIGQGPGWGWNGPLVKGNP